MARIWKQPPDLAQMTEDHIDTAVARLGIEFTEVGVDFLRGRMPVDARTVQPFGVVHGGANVLLAETLGSCAANWVIDRARFRAFGQEVNANHLRPATQGWVTGTARAVHLGRTSQVWSIELVNDAGKPTCLSRLTMAVVPVAASDH